MVGISIARLALVNHSTYQGFLSPKPIPQAVATVIIKLFFNIKSATIIIEQMVCHQKERIKKTARHSTLFTIVHEPLGGHAQKQCKRPTKKYIRTPV